MLLLICWIFGTAGAWFIAHFAYKIGLIDIPGNRSSHSYPIPRGAGIGIFAAFMFASVYLNLPIFFWLPIVLLAIVSLLDDKMNMSPVIKLVLQMIFALLIVAALTMTENARWYYYGFILCAMLFIVGTANFYNFMDGINGIAGITGIVAFSLLTQFAIYSNSETEWAFLAASIAFACLGFLPFNIPSAKVFMGDVGSILIGFLFASLVIILSTDFVSFIVLSSFIFPFYADALTTLYIRWRDKEKLFKAHRRHLYQLFANECGYKHWIIAGGYGLVQLLTGEIAIFIWMKQSLTGLLIMLFSLSLFFIYITFQVRSLANDNNTITLFDKNRFID